MKAKTASWVAGVTILAAGLAAAVLIYVGADDPADDPLEAMRSSKVYARQLQLYGGKASVLFDEMTRWFAGLWQGRKLAFTVGWLSLAAGGGLLLYALRGVPSCALRGEAEDPPRPGDATLPSGDRAGSATGTAGSSADPACPPREGR